MLLADTVQSSALCIGWYYGGAVNKDGISQRQFPWRLLIMPLHYTVSALYIVLWPMPTKSNPVFDSTYLIARRVLKNYALIVFSTLVFCRSRGAEEGVVCYCCMSRELHYVEVIAKVRNGISFLTSHLYNYSFELALRSRVIEIVHPVIRSVGMRWDSESNFSQIPDYPFFQR